MSHEHQEFIDSSLDHLQHQYQIDIADNFNALISDFDAYQAIHSSETEPSYPLPKTRTILGVYVNDSVDPSEGKLVLNRNSALVLTQSPTRDEGYSNCKINLYSNREHLKKNLIGAITFVYDEKHDEVLMYEEETLGELVIDWRDLLRSTDKVLRSRVQQNRQAES